MVVLKHHFPFQNDILQENHISISKRHYDIMTEIERINVLFMENVLFLEFYKIMEYFEIMAFYEIMTVLFSCA